MPTALPILDTHQHLVYPDKWPYTWTDGVPALKGRAFTYEDYLTAIEGAGVSRTLFMETSPDDPHWKEEARFVAGLTAEPLSIVSGVIANCRPEKERGFEEGVESVAHPRLVGFRRILHVEPDGLSQTPHFRSNVAWLGGRGYTFDLCVRSRQIPLAIDLVRACPGTQFILDHCGNPDVAAGEDEPWRGLLRRIAALPNVTCKISGLPANCKPGGATLAALRPYIEHCLDAFGWDRVVWGSDWPVCLVTSDLASWAQITRQAVAGADPADQKKLFYDNAVRIYGVGKAR